MHERKGSSHGLGTPCTYPSRCKRRHFLLEALDSCLHVVEPEVLGRLARGSIIVRSPFHLRHCGVRERTGETPNFSQQL